MQFLGKFGPIDEESYLIVEPEAPHIKVDRSKHGYAAVCRDRLRMKQALAVKVNPDTQVRQLIVIRPAGVRVSTESTFSGKIMSTRTPRPAAPRSAVTSNRPG